MNSLPSTSLIREAERGPPWWVRAVLFGVPDRKTARLFSLLTFALGVLTGAGSLLGAFAYPTGALLLLGLPLYEAAIRWTDRNDAWQSRLR